MNEERFKQRMMEYAQAINRLAEALAQPTNEFMRDAVIQRFEFTYELAWKAAKLWLAGKDIDVRNAKDTLSSALVQGLIADGNGWSQLHEMRNLTSHTYHREAAIKVEAFVRHEAVPLFQALYERLR